MNTETLVIWHHGDVFECNMGILSYPSLYEASFCFDTFSKIVLLLERLDVDIGGDKIIRIQLVEAAIAYIRNMEQESLYESEVGDICTRALRLAFASPVDPENQSVWHYPFLSGCSLVRDVYRLGIAEGLEAALEILCSISGYLSSSTMALIISDVYSMVERRCRLVEMYG